MTTDDNRLAALHLLEMGTLVPFRVVKEEVTPGTDAGEFAVRVEMEMDGEEEAEPADVASWGAFGFMYVLASLSFHDARPRGTSEVDYQERDDFSVCDFLECLRFERGELRFYADYVRGRRMKTGITVRSEGTVTLETLGRGKSPLRWLARLQGKKPLAAVRRDERPA
jgi:hypothetical protein